MSRRHAGVNLCSLQSSVSLSLALSLSLSLFSAALGHFYTVRRVCVSRDLESQHETLFVTRLETFQSDVQYFTYDELIGQVRKE